MVYLALIGFFSFVVMFAQSNMQTCATTIIITQIEQHDNPNGNATVPLVVDEAMDSCVHSWVITAAFALGVLTVVGVTLNYKFSNGVPCQTVHQTICPLRA